MSTEVLSDAFDLLSTEAKGMLFVDKVWVVFKFIEISFESVIFILTLNELRLITQYSKRVRKLDLSSLI